MIDSWEKIQQLLPHLDKMVDEGLTPMDALIGERGRNLIGEVTRSATKAVVEMGMFEVPEFTTDVGLKPAVAPVGSPHMLKLMAPPG